MSTATQVYVTVTIDFIDDTWQLCNRVLLTCEMPQPHIGPNIAEELVHTIDEWSISATRISVCVHDNAANVVNALQKHKKLKKKQDKVGF